MNNWSIRAVQLDLARQMETMDYIRRFIDFASRYDYNTLFLYLEGRVRTKSFPYPADNESYSPGQMREIVDYAAERGMEVIPIASTLGHAEQFVCHSPLEHLAELREGGPGRDIGMGNVLRAFCPSLEDTYTFTEAYFSELAEIFPSEYFHISIDEVWDMGYCSVCRRRIEQDGLTISDLYTEYINRVYNIVSGKLGKRVMMWDDMLEEFPEALDNIPNDIIQCVWQYDSLVDQTRTHFGRRLRDNRLADYDRRGISYIIAPNGKMNLSLRNIESLSSYSQGFKPLGALLTRWECNFAEEEFLAIAFAGRRWQELEQGNARRIFDENCVEIFGISDSVFLNALWAWENLEKWPCSGRMEDLLRGPLSPYGFERLNLVSMLEEIFSSYCDKINSRDGREILGDSLSAVKTEKILHLLREALDDLYAFWNGSPGDEETCISSIRTLLPELDVIINYWQDKVKARRPGLPLYNHTHNHHFCRLEALRRNINEFLGKVEDGTVMKGLLSVRYSLPDFFGWPFVKWSVQYEGIADWQTIYESRNSNDTKPNMQDYSDCPFFMIKTPIPADKKPLRLRMEYRGYGGIGIQYVECVTNHGTMHPLKIENTSGQIANPENILENDTGWCWVGISATKEAYHKHELAARVHALEIEF